MQNNNHPNETSLLKTSLLRNSNAPIDKTNGNVDT